MLLLLLEIAKGVLLQELNLSHVSAPVTICGDLRGQFDDLKEIFKLAGDLPDTNYLFLGGYVNQGRFSVELISLLLAFKVRYPKRITLLRGFFESRKISQMKGFYDEILMKYGSSQVWNAFVQVFDYLPYTAVIDKEIFCVHSGLSPSLETLDDILASDRVGEIPHDGLLFDLVWSRPSDKLGWNNISSGFGYGKNITKAFLLNNGLSCLFRSHDMVMEGYEFTHDNDVATVFSASNFLGRRGNEGAICEVKDNLEYDFIKYTSVSKPDRSRAQRMAINIL